MMKTLMTLALCFGIGLGLAPLVRPAQACSCEEGSEWTLELEQIAGNGDFAVEQAFWTPEATLGDGYYNSGRADLYLGTSDLELERMP